MTKPRDPIISYLLLAEFDIDQGSVLKHQFPHPTGCNDHLLAELMLPDGAHLRSEDWTIFYLNQTPATAVGQQGNPPEALHPEKELPKPPLLHVINLVRTKIDAAANRGAYVKALAVCSPYPFVQIFKPLLLLGLEDYFKDPTVATLSKLFSAINTLNLSLAPNFTRHEKLIIRSSDRKDLFEERFTDEDGQPLVSSISNGSLRSDNLGRSLASEDANWHPHDLSSIRSTEDDTASSVEEMSQSGDLARSRAGTNTTSVSDHQSFKRRQSTAETFATSTNEAHPVPNLSRRPKDTHFYDTKIQFGNIRMPIRLPLTTFPEEVGDYSLIKLIQTFTAGASSTFGPVHPHLHTHGASTHPIIVLFNALITQKRILFLGNGQPAGQVANMVLAACALGSGCGSVLRGFTERAFPYSNLLNADNANLIPGYIAGVTNPRFEDLTSLWDVLCNIETGKITINKDINSNIPSDDESPLSPASVSSGNMPFGINGTGIATALTGDVNLPPKDKTDNYDSIFMDEIVNTINSHFGEAVIRARFIDYVWRFVRLASLHEEETFGSTAIGFPSHTFTPGKLGSGMVFFDDAAKQRELSVNRSRIEAWRKTKSYLLFKEDFANDRAKRINKSLDLPYQISRLRQAKRMSPQEVDLILRTIQTTFKSEEQVLELLALLPPHFGGLLPMAFGLFHPNEIIRNHVIDFFDMLRMLHTGRKFLQSLNAFHRQSYYRQSQFRHAEKQALMSPITSGANLHHD